MFTVSVCVMSNYSKSRVISLQILTRMCQSPRATPWLQIPSACSGLSSGSLSGSSSSLVNISLTHFTNSISFVTGMLNSFNSPAFQISCLRFLNIFVQTANTVKEQVQIQCELEEAGFDIVMLKRIHLKVGRNLWN